MRAVSVASAPALLLYVEHNARELALAAHDGAAQSRRADRFAAKHTTPFTATIPRAPANTVARISLQQQRPKTKRDGMLQCGT